MKSRREFVKTISKTTVALGCGFSVISLMQGCTSIRYIPAVIQDNQIRVSKKEFIEQQFVIITGKDLPAPIYVVKNKKDEKFSAFSMLCTHLGCELKPTGSFLSCPCHGSEFSNKGEVLQGPASEALTEYILIDSEAEIIIDITKIKKT